MAYLTHTHSGGLGMGGRIYDAWSMYRSEQRQNTVYRDTVRQLHDLNDRVLEDIGVTRHDIEVAAHEHAYKR